MQRIPPLLSIINLIGLVTLITLLFFRNKTEVTELELEKLTIVENDGTRSLIIANSEKLPGSIIGKHRGESRGAPGMLFYNHKGNESGGLIFNSYQEDSTYYNYHHLSFDQFDDDQVLALTNNEGNGYHRKGLMINQLPYDQNLYDFFEGIDSIMAVNPELSREQARRKMVGINYRKGKGMIQRLFVGSENGESKIELSDPKGQVRIQMSIDPSNNKGIIIFYDSDGNEVKRISE